MIKTLTLIDAICAIALFVTAFMGLHAKMEKRVSDWLSAASPGCWSRCLQLRPPFDKNAKPLAVPGCLELPT